MNQKCKHFKFLKSFILIMLIQLNLNSGRNPYDDIDVLIDNKKDHVLGEVMILMLELAPLKALLCTFLGEFTEVMLLRTWIVGTFMFELRTFSNSLCWLIFSLILLSNLEISYIFLTGGSIFRSSRILSFFSLSLLKACYSALSISALFEFFKGFSWEDWATFD